MLAVSHNVIPSSTARRKIGSAPSSFNVHGSNSLGSPKLMQPRVIRLALRPEEPSRVYSMVQDLPSRRCFGGAVRAFLPPTHRWAKGIQPARQLPTVRPTF